MQGQQPGRFRSWALGDVILVLVLFVAAFVLDSSASPHHQQFNPDDPRMGYPVLASTVPTWLLFVIAALLPPAIFVVTYIGNRPENSGKAAAELRRVLLAYFLALGCTLLVTIAGKKLAGRPRPNAVALSGYIGGKFTAKDSDVSEAFQSFPSGHSSISFVAMVWLSLYFMHKLRSDRSEPNNEGWKFVVCAMPTVLAFWVGITRMTDYWHNPSDVLAGALLGTAFAVVIFRAYYLKHQRPSPSSTLPFYAESSQHDSDDMKVPLSLDSTSVNR